MDTLVTVEKNNGVTKIETELFIKPMNSDIILNHDFPILQWVPEPEAVLG